MRFRRRKVSGSTSTLPMSTLIDIVFLLLVFFVMTLKIAPVEGDFQMRVPDEQGPGPAHHLPLVVKLQADEAGELSEIWLGDRALGDLSELGLLCEELAASAVNEEIDLQLDCDPRLRYEYAIDALSVVALVNEKNAGAKLDVRFAPQRRERFE